MALTITPRPLDKDNNNKVVSCALFTTLTSITLDASYATGGIPLTPAQLGLTGAVYFGVVNIRTNSATGPGDGTLDCSSPGAPKMKLQAAANTAELAAGAASGAIIDVLAFGY